MKRIAHFCAMCLVTSQALAEVPFNPGDWPQWRGPHRNGIGAEQGLLREWPQGGPKQLWKVDHAGVGYSSLAVKDGRIFTQGDIDGIEHIIALSVQDGSLLWAVQPGPVSLALEQRVSTEFKQLDRNDNGQIDETEALARWGWDFNRFDKPSSEASDDVGRRRAEALFKELDRDDNSLLEFSEAGSLLRDAFERSDRPDSAADAEKLAADRATQALAQFDKDADGKLSRQEVRGSALDRNFFRADSRIEGTNKGDDQLTADELQSYFQTSEKGKDGVISSAELTTAYVDAKLTGDGVLGPDEVRRFFGGYRNGMGDGPRGTPTVDGTLVYAEGGDGDVTCLDASTGKTVWHVNLRKQFGGGLPGWGYSESPLVVGDLLIVTPGGRQGTLVALNKQTGDVVWQSRDVTEAAHYASPVLAEIGGKQQIIQFARESAFGVDIETGKLLWKYSQANNGTANCCDPIVEGEFVFASSGYGTGGGLAKIVTNGDKQAAEQVYFEKKMACHHGGIVKIGDYMYSNGGGPLLCMHYQTGEIAWQARSVGKGSLIAADGLLFVLSENHQVALVEATPEEYREKGRFSLQTHGRPSWAHPVVAGGKLLIRDQTSLSAYDVRVD